MLRDLRCLLRLLVIARTLARSNALFPFDLIPQAKPVTGLLRPFVNKNAQGRPGERLARALTELGPTFIKLGQSLATRSDLLGEAICRDLSALQDRLEPFDASIARAVIEAELDDRLEAHFAQFEDRPVAAASIAQVHFAVTVEGEEVAVKILRPGIEQAIERDLDLFAWLAGWIEWLHPPIRRFKPMDVVGILTLSTRRELDLRLEAAASAEFAHNCADLEGFRVPKVDWRRTAKKVVTFEWVAGLPVDEPERLRAAGLDPDTILETAASVFFSQVFRDGFFHADMHPGNMMIEPGTGTIIALDFGIMGRLGPADRRRLGEILLGFLSRDYRRVADVFFDAGFLPPDQDREAFQLACRAIAEPILGRPLAEISIGRLLGQLLFVAEQFEMQSQPQFTLLQKTMVVSEGVGRVLNPNVNIWATAQPLVEAWMRDNLGPEARLGDAVSEGVAGIRRLHSLVREAEALLRAERVGGGSRRRPFAGERWGAWLAILAAGIAIGLAL